MPPRAADPTSAVCRVMSVVGARPQFIKLAPVSQALRAGGMEEVVVHTGQHYDRLMSQVFFNELNLQEPHATLHVGSGTHAVQTGHMLEKLERVWPTRAWRNGTGVP